MLSSPVTSFPPKANGSSLPYRTLRALARNTRTVRRLGYDFRDIRAISESAGWHSSYDVRIGGRRFTLWTCETFPGASVYLYAVTIDGRVRFLDRSSVFSCAMEAWEVVTGIRYLGFYEDGSPIYGHREEVEVLPAALPFNYSRPLRRIENPPVRSYPDSHDMFRVES